MSIDLDELREVCARLLEYFGDLDSYEGATIEATDSDSGDIVYAELPAELAGLLDELRDVIQTEDEDE